MKRKGKEDKGQDRVLVFNIGGQKFTLHRNSILAQPNTKLAKMIKEGKLEMEHSDSLNKRQCYFDRSSDMFAIVQKFYQTGHLPLSEIDVNAYNLWDEFAYWEINFPPPLAEMVDFFADKKENVKRYFDGLFVKTKTPHEKFEDLYFQSFPPDLPRYHGPVEIKAIAGEPVYEEMSEDLYALLERAQTMGTKEKKLALKKYSKNKFLLPKKGEQQEDLLHPLLKQLYWHLIDTWNELGYVARQILPVPLVDIVDRYLYADEGIDENYLRATYALYSVLIDAAVLFDKDDDPSCLFARQYATRYLDEKGVKSTWKMVKISCNDVPYDTVYPLSFANFIIEPTYKCSYYITKHSGYHETRGHCNRFDIRYLHFEWPL